MFNLTNGCNDVCGCDPYGSLSPACEKYSGQCACKPNTAGTKCNYCQSGFYNFTSLGCLNKCACDLNGSIDNKKCDIFSGQCTCREGYAGVNCNLCAKGFWKINSNCVKCDCNLNGVLDKNNICNQVNLFTKT
jgi:hypothetical protein